MPDGDIVYTEKCYGYQHSDDIDLCQLGELLQQAAKKEWNDPGGCRQSYRAARTTIVAIEKVGDPAS